MIQERNNLARERFDLVLVVDLHCDYVTVLDVHQFNLHIYIMCIISKKVNSILKNCENIFVHSDHRACSNSGVQQSGVQQQISEVQTSRFRWQTRFFFSGIVPPSLACGDCFLYFLYIVIIHIVSNKVNTFFHFFNFLCILYSCHSFHANKQMPMNAMQ